MSDGDLTSLAEFISQGGVIDVGSLISSETKKVINGDVANGQLFYESTCLVCHGVDGAALGEALGELSNDNPWEVMHKVRFGQPGTAMPAAVDSIWTLKDIVDLVAYVQSLP
jgi:thiosulfate dehydrogenase